MTATGELRRLLDELRKLARDINEKEIRSHSVITLNQGRYNRQFRLDMNHDWLNAWHAELERILQAIEATLGHACEPPVAAHWDGDELTLTIPRDPSCIRVQRSAEQPCKVYADESKVIAATLKRDDAYTREDVESAFVSGYSLGSLPVGSDPQWDENTQTVDEHMAEHGWVRKDKEHVISHATVEITPHIDWSRMADELDVFTQLVRGFAEQVGEDE